MSKCTRNTRENNLRFLALPCLYNKGQRLGNGRVNKQYLRSKNI